MPSSGWRSSWSTSAASWLVWWVARRKDSMAVRAAARSPSSMALRSSSSGLSMRARSMEQPHSPAQSPEKTVAPPAAAQAKCRKPRIRMPQTNPFHALVPRKLSDAELAMAMRLNLEAEMDAINLYAAHVEATDNEEAKAILRHVMDEEREHAALFKELIRRLDPAQARHDAEAPKKYGLI